MATQGSNPGGLRWVEHEMGVAGNREVRKALHPES